MSDKTKKPVEQIPAKYKLVENGGTYRGVDPENPLGFTRDPANGKRHGPKPHIAEGTEDAGLDW
jgi:hypothetical protein